MPKPRKVQYRGIPAPTHDVRVLLATVEALKENIELLTAQRPGVLPPVTWEDLLRLGLIEEGDVPIV